MQKAYIETSVINKACNESIAVKDIVFHLKAMGFVPAIGMHTIYELAKTFLVPGQSNRGSKLFSMLRDMDPSLIPLTAELHKSEIESLRTGETVLPFLDTNDQAATRYEIEKLANGNFDSKAEQFIRSREQKIRDTKQVITESYLKHISEVKSDNPNLLKEIRNFDDVILHFKDRIPDYVKEIVKIRISDLEAVEVAHRLDSFPALRSAVRANLYLCFICIVYGVPPSNDKPNDYRHIIDSSYSNSIVTADKGLHNVVKKINPSMNVITWKDLKKKLVTHDSI